MEFDPIGGMEKFIIHYYYYYDFNTGMKHVRGFDMC